MRVKSRMTAQLKSSSKIEGTPHEGCWQNQSGYRYHSATFSPALGVLHEGHQPVTDPLMGWAPKPLSTGFDGMLHESRTASHRTTGHRYQSEDPKPETRYAPRG